MMIFLFLLSQLAVVSDSSGLMVFDQIPIRSKGFAQYEIVMDSMIGTIEYGDTVRLYDRINGPNYTEWAYVSYKRIYYETGDTIIRKMEDISGWSLIRYRSKWYVNVIGEEKKSFNIPKFIFTGGITYGQSLDEFKKLDTTVDFRLYGLIFVFLIIGELVLICVLGKWIKKLFKNPIFVLFGAWLLTAVGFGYGRLEDILFIFKGGLK